MTPADEPAKLPCAEKLVFDTKQQADTAANVAEYQRGIRLKSYHCRYCDLWHLATDYGSD
jgi:hypothetical protein